MRATQILPWKVKKKKKKKRRRKWFLHRLYVIDPSSTLHLFLYLFLYLPKQQLCVLVSLLKCLRRYQHPSLQLPLSLPLSHRPIEVFPMLRSLYCPNPSLNPTPTHILTLSPRHLESKQVLVLVPLARPPNLRLTQVTAWPAIWASSYTTPLLCLKLSHRKVWPPITIFYGFFYRFPRLNGPQIVLGYGVCGQIYFQKGGRKVNFERKRKRKQWWWVWAWVWALWMIKMVRLIRWITLRAVYKAKRKREKKKKRDTTIWIAQGVEQEWVWWFTHCLCCRPTTWASYTVISFPSTLMPPHTHPPLPLLPPLLRHHLLYPLRLFLLIP